MNSWPAMTSPAFPPSTINSRMTRSIPLLLCVLLLAGVAAAQMNAVETGFKKDKAKYTREFFSMGEDASSGYDYVFYKSEPKIVMIRVIWSASYTNELRIDDFYFDKDITLHRKQTAQKRQLSILKRGRDVPLVVKEEHHFTAGKLTKWILDSKTIPSTDARWAEAEKGTLEQARSERDNYTWLKENQ